MGYTLAVHVEHVQNELFRIVDLSFEFVYGDSEM